MKILPSMRYQLRDHRNPILVYYGVLVAMILLTLLFIPFSGDSRYNVATSGVTAVTMFFLFICSLCAFKDSFRFNLQHGTSRKTQFLARMGTMGIICALLAVADEIYTLLMALLEFLMPGNFFSSSLYEMIYSVSVFDSRDGVISYSVETNTSTVLCSVVFSFFFLLAASSFAYLITVFNYRLNKIGKIIFWVSWPFAFTAVSAFLDANPKIANNLAPVLTQVSRVTIATLPRFCVTCTLLTAVFLALTWLLMRRAHIK